MKNAEKKIADLETIKTELETKNDELSESLKESRTEIEKRDAKIAVLMDALTGYRKFGRRNCRNFIFTGN